MKYEKAEKKKRWSWDMNNRQLTVDQTALLEN